MKLDKYLDKRVPPSEPPGADVFDLSTNISKTDLRHLLADAYRKGYSERTKELQEELAGRYLQMLDSLKIQPIKLPFWRRWFIRLPKG